MSKPVRRKRRGTKSRKPEKENLTERPGPSIPRQASMLAVATGAIASQAVLLTTLLYYIGWVRTQATFGYFGIDSQILDFSTSDYVLRSLNSAFPPLIVATLLGLAFFTLHRTVVTPWVKRNSKWSNWAVKSGLVIGGSLATLVCVQLIAPGALGTLQGAALPASLVLSVATVAYCSHLRTLSGRENVRADHELPGSGPGRRVRTTVLLGLGMMGMLWLLASYAEVVGVARAEAIAARFAGDPAVTIYSKTPLAIYGAGVNVAKIGVEGDKYRYVYTGLRLLTSAGERLIVVASDWRKGDNVYVIPDDESIRMDIAASQ